MYIGPALFPKLLPNERMVDAFMSLFGGIFLLAHPNLNVTSEWFPFAKRLLISFIEKVKDMYGIEFLVYNVHSLVHLPDDVKKYGPLDKFSCFKYENYLRFLKQKVHSSYLPLQQVINRVLEQDVCLGHLADSANSLVKSQSSKKSVHFSTFTLKLNSKDCFFLSKDKEVYKFIDVKHYSVSEVICQRFQQKTDAFTKPFCSSRLDIYLISDLGKPQKIHQDQILCKMIVIKISGGFYASPIIHTIPGKDHKIIIIIECCTFESP